MTTRSFGIDKWGPYVVYLTVPCRKCDKCRIRRMRLWAARACCEIALASRTWHVTLTLAPQWHSVFYLRAVEKAGDTLSSDGVLTKDAFDRMAYQEQFAGRHAQINIEITKMLKRLRAGGSTYRDDDGTTKRCEAASFRQLIVVEPHTGKRGGGLEGPNFGLPHYHMLLHETAAPIKKRVIQAAWSYGFTTARLVGSDGAWYVAKYLGKTLAARVRASSHYGGLLSASAVGNGK